MELRHLRYFVAVAEELHFGRAARRLHISQPPLSAQIRDLEHEFGVTLFERSHHKVELTDAGRQLLPRARDVLQRAVNLAVEAASVARGASGLVSVGYTTTAAYDFLPRWLELSQQRLPLVAIRLEELPSPAQAFALDEQRIDIGLACLPVAAHGALARPLVRERITVALPARHPLAKRRQLRLADLCGVTQVVLRNSQEQGWAQACAAELARAGVHAPVAAEADTKLALLGLVAAQLGIAVISSSLATLGRPGVVFRTIADVRRPLILGALHRPRPSALVSQLLELAAIAGRDSDAEPLSRHSRKA
ncbi:MAG TPA: LysR substrate-binding domain-containing protein [Polyangiaceae bacterium]